MAERRMFAKSIVSTDNFIDMPSSAQALYFHFGVNADDDGFLANPRSIMRTVGASQDDFRLLCAKGYCILFESSVVVITHWRQSNYIQKDRYKPTTHTQEINSLDCKNGVYSINISSVNDMDTQCIHDVSDSDTQVRLGKAREGEVREGKEYIPPISPKGETRKRFVPPSVEQVKEYCIERNNNINPENFVDFYSAKGWMVGKNKMKDWKACIRTWEKNEKPQRPDYSDPERYKDMSWE